MKNEISRIVLAFTASLVIILGILITNVVFAAKDSASIGKPGELLRSLIGGNKTTINLNNIQQQQPQPLVTHLQASANSSTNFLTYTNSTYGFRIQYPSSWSVEAGKNDANDTTIEVVDISPPISSDPHAAAGLFVHVDTQPGTNNLDQYLRDTIDGYRSGDNSLSAYKLINSNTNATLGGNPAYLLMDSYNKEGIGTVHSLETGTLIGHHVYIVTFQAEPMKYPTFLPTVQQIINSFELTKSSP